MDDQPTTAELLTAWRDATRASELAERLALAATEAAEIAERNASASEDIARMAERAANAAERAARTARKAATRARAFAQDSRDSRARLADETVVEAREREAEARAAYHDSERQARERHGGSGSS
jgi:hypothetical protein